jgi:hypothetical protein
VVPGTVFAGVRDGVTVHDGYTAYDRPCEGTSQQCCAHVMRRFERLLKKEPENRECRAFVPKTCGLLAEALDLYAKTGSKARVRDFLFPKVMPSKRPGNPVRGTEAGGDALGIQAAARGAAASARAAG